MQQTYDPDYPREDRDNKTVEILCDKLVYDYMTGRGRWNWHQIRQFFLDAYIDYYVDAMLSEGVVKHSLMVEHDIHRDDLMDAMRYGALSIRHAQTPTLRLRRVEAPQGARNW